MIKKLVTYALATTVVILSLSVLSHAVMSVVWILAIAALSLLIWKVQKA